MMYDALNDAGTFFMFRSLIPGSDRLTPMIQVVTISDEEVGARVKDGAHVCDVLDEWTTSIWFTDRDTFRMAWRAARQIARGTLFAPSFKAGWLHQFNPADDLISEITINPSIHHIAQEAA